MKLAEGSRTAAIYSNTVVGVNSYHHQAVKDLGCGFVAVGKSVEDHVVEAMELPGDRFVVGVQWHPEMMVDSQVQPKIFKAFVEARQR